MRKYWAFFRINIFNTITYRGSLLIWLMGNLVSLLVMVAVWLSVGTSNSLVGGYTKSGLITYYVFSGFLWWIVGWHCFEWVREIIKDGTITTQNLTKPLSFYWQVFFEELGWHTVGTPIGLLASLFSLFIVSQFTPLSLEFHNLIFLIPSLIIGTLIIFTINITLGLLTFFFTETESLNHIIWAGIFIFGGQSVPLSFFPGIFQTIVQFLPTRYMLSFPLELLFGKLTSWEIAWGFGVGLIWVAVLCLAYKILWNRGTKAYSSFGS